MEDLLLSIESATNLCSVALHRGGKLEATFEWHGLSSDMLGRMVDKLLRMAEVSVKELAAVAVSKGPGSYTGLRIGAALAKGICYGGGVPLVAVSTLEMLIKASSGYPLPSNTLCCGLLDARRGYAYALLTDQAGKVIKDTFSCEMGPKAFQEWGRPYRLCFMGSGADKYKDLLSRIKGAMVIEGLYPKASLLGKLAYARYRLGDYMAPEAFSPLYLSAFGGIPLPPKD